MTEKNYQNSECKKTRYALIFGLDKDGKPRGGRYPKLRDDFVSAVMDMGFQVQPIPDELESLVAKMPLGRIYSSGKGYIPPIRKALFDKIQDAYRAWEAKYATQEVRAPRKDRPTVSESAPADAGSGKGRVGNLPHDWDAIVVGDAVIAPISPDAGWWVSIVMAREGDLLTLRYRDYPKKPPFVRHISTVARVHPLS